MSFIRHYILEAKAGAAADLRAVLLDLEAAVRTLPGSEGVEILQPDGAPSTFHLVERWASKEHHAAAGSQIPRGMTDALKATLGGAPTSFSLRPIA